MQDDNMGKDEDAAELGCAIRQPEIMVRSNSRLFQIALKVAEIYQSETIPGDFGRLWP